MLLQKAFRRKSQEMADTEDFIKYKEAKEDLQQSIFNFLEVCSSMTPEMEVVRDLAKLRGDFGRNKEAKWLAERNKIEEAARKRRQEERMSAEANVVLQGLGLVPMNSLAPPPSPAPGSIAGSTVSNISARDELDMTIGRLHRLRMSGEISAEELKQRLDQMRI